MTDNILLATSIPPVLSRRNAGREFGEDYQRLCVRSWLECGFRILSVNDADEIPELANRHPEIAFVPTARNASAITGRKNPYIGDLVGALLATGEPHLGIVNSDIALQPAPAWQSQLPALLGNSVVAVQRHDTHSLPDGALRRYYWGYDVFFFDRRMALEIADHTGSFAMGLPWWDYLLPAAAAVKDRAFRILERPVAVHLAHPQAYDGAGVRQFEVEFATFVAASADREVKAPTPAWADLVVKCRDLLARNAAYELAGSNAPPVAERFAETIAPWLRALLADSARLEVGPDVAPRQIENGFNPAAIFRDLDNRLQAGSALDGAKYHDIAGKADEALRLFQTALHRTPEDFGVLVEFGAFLCRSGGARDALALFEKARAQQPASARVLNDLGVALRALHRHDEAIARFKQALESDPEFRDVYYNLAVSLYEMRQAPAAVACLDAALAKWPNAGDLSALRGAFLHSAAAPRLDRA